MKPERAWFVQARSDLRSALVLEANGGDTCQIVMHLQMCGEKLVKGYIRSAGTVPFTHRAVHNYFSHLRNVVVGSPNLRLALMGKAAGRREVNSVLRSLKRTMRSVEALNPSAAVNNSPNCEYPWETIGPPQVGHAPATHRFGNPVGRAARTKFYRLLDRVLTAEGA